MKRIVFLVICLSLLCSCSNSGNEAPQQDIAETIVNEKDYIGTKTIDNKEPQILDDAEEQKSFYGEWKVIKLFFTDTPSIWEKKELEGYIEKKLLLSVEKVVFDGRELLNPIYGEQILSSEELANELVTTYEAIGLNFECPPTFVTIYSDIKMTEKEEWISDSIIYRFFVKDENTLIAENRNAYFELVRINDDY